MLSRNSSVSDSILLSVNSDSTSLKTSFSSGTRRPGCWLRRREVTDSLVDLLIQAIHKIGVRAEKRVEKELLDDLKRVTGKTAVLFRIAEAAG